MFALTSLSETEILLCSYNLKILLQIPQTQTCTKEEICQEGENNHTQPSEEDVVVNIEVKEMQEDGTYLWTNVSAQQKVD